MKMMIKSKLKLEITKEMKRNPNQNTKQLKKSFWKPSLKHLHHRYQSNRQARLRLEEVWLREPIYTNLSKENSMRNFLNKFISILLCKLTIKCHQF